MELQVEGHHLEAHQHPRAEAGAAVQYVSLLHPRLPSTMPNCWSRVRSDLLLVQVPPLFFSFCRAAQIGSPRHGHQYPSTGTSSSLTSCSIFYPNDAFINSKSMDSCFLPIQFLHVPDSGGNYLTHLDLPSPFSLSGLMKISITS